MADSTKIDTNCPVCQETFTLKYHYPKLLPCNHTVCKSCIKEMGQDFDCPVCRFHIESTDILVISTNFMAINAVKNEDALSGELWDTETTDVDNYDDELTPTADMCPVEASVHAVECDTATSVEETLKEKLNAKFTESFEETSDRIERYEDVIEGLKLSKEEILEKIEYDFENLVHLLLRRKQLLKNQVLTQYEEKLEAIEENMEKVTFTTMCLNSLQKHSEVIFAEHEKFEKDMAPEKMAVQDKKSQEEESCGKLAGNCQKISFEISELQEKLEDIGSIKEMKFTYEISDQSDVCKGLEKLESNQLFTMMNIKNESGLDSHLIQETPEGIEVIADPTTAQIESVTLPEHIDDAELSGSDEEDIRDRSLIKAVIQNPDLENEAEDEPEMSTESEEEQNEIVNNGEKKSSEELFQNVKLEEVDSKDVQKALQEIADMESDTNQGDRQDTDKEDVALDEIEEMQEIDDDQDLEDDDDDEIVESLRRLNQDEMDQLRKEFEEEKNETEENETEDSLTAGNSKKLEKKKIKRKQTKYCSHAPEILKVVQDKYDRLCKVCFNEHKGRCLLADPIEKYQDNEEVGPPYTYGMPDQILIGLSRVHEGSYSLFARDDIPAYTQFGPLKGRIIDKEEFSKMALVEIELEDYWPIEPSETDELVIDKWIDTREVEMSNWLKFLLPESSSPDSPDYNIQRVVHDDEIFFVTTHYIPAGEELFMRVMEPPYRVYHNLSEMKKDRFVCSMYHIHGMGQNQNMEFENMIYYVRHSIFAHSSVPGVFRCANIYNCGVCGVDCYDPTLREEHMISEHSGPDGQSNNPLKKDRRCYFCKKMFSNQAQLAHHMKYSHPKTREIAAGFECPLCKKITKTKTTLRRHLQDTHMPVEVPCEICGKILKNRGSLKVHIRKVHEKSNFKSCLMCDKSFSDSYQLRVHTLTHTKLKPYECAFADCLMDFTTKQCLEKHYKNKHGLIRDNMPEIQRKFELSDVLIEME